MRSSSLFSVVLAAFLCFILLFCPSAGKAFTEYQPTPAPSPTLEVRHGFYEDDPEKAQILQQWLDLATSSPSPVSTQRHSSSIIAYAIAAAFISILTLIYKLIKDSLRRKFDERRRKKEVVNLLTPENKQNPEQPESRPRVSLKKE